MLRSQEKRGKVIHFAIAGEDWKGMTSLERGEGIFVRWIHSLHRGSHGQATEDIASKSQKCGLNSTWRHVPKHGTQPV